MQLLRLGRIGRALIRRHIVVHLPGFVPGLLPVELGRSACALAALMIIHVVGHPNAAAAIARILAAKISNRELEPPCA